MLHVLLNVVFVFVFVVVSGVVVVGGAAGGAGGVGGVGGVYFGFAV